MSHHIDGFIGHIDHLKARFSFSENAKVIPLPHKRDMGFVPLTDELYDEIHAISLDVDPILWVGKMAAPIAWIRTDYFGGAGEQEAILFKIGRRRKINGQNCINKALRALGVKSKKDFDEFDTIGLGKHRSNNSWLGIEGF